MPAGARKGSDRRTDVEVWNATDLDVRSRLSRLLPKPNDAHAYVLRDPGLRRAGNAMLLATHTIHQAGDLQLSRVSERFGTRIMISDPGLPYHCFTLPRQGLMQVTVPGAARPASVGGTQGAIHAGQGGTMALTGDGSARLNLWVSTRRLEAALAAALGETARAPLLFEPALDWSRGCGPALRRLVLHLDEEFARTDGIASSPMALAAFVDLFAHTALMDLQHNYSDRLARGHDAASPRTLRRAEEFLLAHAAEPLRMEQVAAAAGCSIRALQLAFRRFRDTTPWAALQEIRLNAARQDLQGGDAPVAAAARRWGFTCAGRFAAVYRRRFGEPPAATRRAAKD